MVEDAILDFTTIKDNNVKIPAIFSRDNNE